MNNDRFVKVGVSLVLVGSYFLLPKYGFTSFQMDAEGVKNHLLYPLSHANIWHLLANISCLWMINSKLHVAATFAMAVLCSLLPCFVSDPTMGYSGALFAMVGISWGKIHRFKDMIWRNKWILIIPAFLPHINFMIHLYCLVAGYLYGSLIDRHICARK